MARIDRDEILRFVTAALLSLLAWFGQGIYRQQADILARLRTVELNQARLMARMDVEPVAYDPQCVQKASEIRVQ